MRIEELTSHLASPARRALAPLGLDEVSDLTRYTRATIAALHGIGPDALAKIEAALAREGLRFKSGD